MKNIMEYKTIDNTIVKAATKENKINDLSVERANNLIESLEIEKNRSAAIYLDYAKENGIKTSDKNSIGRKILQCHLMKYGVSNIWYKAAEKHNVNTKEELYNVYFNQLVEMLKNEIKEIEPTEKEEKTKDNYINLTKEEHQELVKLSNIWGRKIPTDKEQGKSEFLHLLFKYQEQKKTKEELKKHINKLYAVNKSIKEANKNKKGYNNYLIDILATEDILQSNDTIKNEFFKNAYNYIKSC